MVQDQAQTVERTLILLKPDALARGLAGAIWVRCQVPTDPVPRPSA